MSMFTTSDMDPEYAGQVLHNGEIRTLRWETCSSCKKKKRVFARMLYSSYEDGMEYGSHVCSK